MQGPLVKLRTLKCVRREEFEVAMPGFSSAMAYNVIASKKYQSEDGSLAQ